MNPLESMLLLVSLLICVIAASRPSKKISTSSKETRQVIPSNIQITCKECQKHGYMHEFNNCCDNTKCQIIMAKRTKPPVILTKVEDRIRHHPRCACARCLDAGADKVEAALLAAPVKVVLPAPRQVSIRVMYKESPVIGPTDDVSTSVCVDVPLVLCTNIYPKGKK